MTTESRPRKRLTWRLRVLMAERGIKNASQLQRRMQEVGHAITSAHAARIVGVMPQRISVELISTLLTVLDCRISELIAEVPADENEADHPEDRPLKTTKSAPSRTKDTGTTAKREQRPLGDKATEILVGPKVMAYPIPDEE